MHHIEAYSSVYTYPGKGHDRVYMDIMHGFFGVFDGAAGEELSEAIIQELPTVLAALSHETEPQGFLSHVMASLDNLPQGLIRKSTAAIACLRETDKDILLTHGHAGDASLYLYDRPTENLDCLAHTPTAFIMQGGRRYISTAEFLGNFRQPEDFYCFIGTVALPKDSEWSLIGMSDGVIDDEGQGISLEQLHSVLASTAASEAPDAVLDQFAKYDDASLFIINHAL